MRTARDSRVDWNSALSKKLKGAERLFVLGVGNPRNGDDAAGSLCISLLMRELKRRKQHAGAGEVGRERSSHLQGSKKENPALTIQALDAGESPENATGLIREFRPTHVLIVDAALGGFEPGTIFIVDREKISQDDISTHRIPLVHLIRYLEAGVGCRVVLVGIEPKNITWQRHVSAPVKKAAARLAAWLAAF